MMTRWAKLNDQGFPIAFGSDDIYPEQPEGTIEITEAQWLECLANQGRRRFEDGVLVEYVPPDITLVTVPVVDSWGLARFTVAAGVLTQAGDAKNIAGIIRLGAGKYRICLDAPPETLMAFPFALDPSNDRRAFPASRAADRFDIRVVSAAGLLCDAAEVYVEFKRMV